MKNGIDDEDLGEDDRDRRERQRDAEHLERGPDRPAPAEGEEQGQPGDRRRQDDGQVDECLGDDAAPERVPGEEQCDREAEQRRRLRR